MFFRIHILGGLRDDIFAILSLFGVAFGEHLGYRFCIDFQRISRACQNLEPGLDRGRFGGYLGSSYKYYRSKSAGLQKVVSLSANQLIR